MAVRLQHAAVTFPPGGEERLRAFYGGVLGIPEMPVPEEVRDRGWIWFSTRDAGVELHFIPHETPPDPDRIHHFCLQVDDLDAARRQLEAAGHPCREARDVIHGRARCFVRDPFGNLVELVEIRGD